MHEKGLFMIRHSAVVGVLLSVSWLAPAAAQNRPSDSPKLDTTRGDKMLADYFAAETAKLRDACLADIKTLDDWKAKRGEYRRQLLEMLGLDPLPEKTDLKPVITGKLDHDDFVVEKLHFQSRPGLYVTGNLYLPKKIDKPLPTILYVCGHSVVKVDGVAMGAKAGYQHHGAWYARNGYACLTIDTLQLGEIEGIHHGTHRYGMWWWLNRGYTPAGVEAWNCVRALDYLETRPEIDKTRFGVTGRSGGGAYSWWIAAIDDRIKAAVPTAGITDLQNHVVDGTVEGHCDCMFMVNTYRWDYPQVAALIAPRPLLISNTDTDRIFPLDGVVRTSHASPLLKSKLNVGMISVPSPSVPSAASSARITVCGPPSTSPNDLYELWTSNVSPSATPSSRNPPTRFSNVNMIPPKICHCEGEARSNSLIIWQEIASSLPFVITQGRSSQ